MRTRFAPTPSGFLHEGNCVNALLTSWWAADYGQVLLRIDDADSTRYRREFADDIFQTLEWLDVRIDLGPQSLMELADAWSQSHRKARYRAALQPILDCDRAFACACSRTSAQCPCVSHARAWVPPENALRLRTSDGRAGPVLWRRDDIPAYHLTSVVDDHDFLITHVMRGEDLRESTRIQRHLAALMGLTFPGDVRHHPLVTDQAHRKLSKSTGLMGPLEKSAEVRERIVQAATRMATLVDVRPSA